MTKNSCSSQITDNLNLTMKILNSSQNSLYSMTFLTSVIIIFVTDTHFSCSVFILSQNIEFMHRFWFESCSCEIVSWNRIKQNLLNPVGIIQNWITWLNKVMQSIIIRWYQPPYMFSPHAQITLLSFSSDLFLVLPSSEGVLVKQTWNKKVNVVFMAKSMI